jgi:hypothetical protein
MGGRVVNPLRILGIGLACPMLALGQVSHTICDVQQYDSQGLSPLSGQVVTVRGAVTFPPGYLVPTYTSFYIEEDHCGVSVFSFELLPSGLALGDSVEVTGIVEEYVTVTSGASTEIMFAYSTDVEVVSTGNPASAPADMSIAAMQVEAHEGRLLRTVGIVIDTDHDLFMDLTDGSDTLRIFRSFNESVSFTAYGVDDTLRVTGVLHQHDPDSPWLDGYQLIPRFQDDIERWHVTALSPTCWGRIKALYRNWGTARSGR